MWATEEELIDVTHRNSKQRFQVCRIGGHYAARAVQGHSMSAVQDDAVLMPLAPQEVPQYLVHGTACDFYESIFRSGLLPGGAKGKNFRKHVHLTDRTPNQGEVISGSAQIPKLHCGSMRATLQRTDSNFGSPATVSTSVDTSYRSTLQALRSWQEENRCQRLTDHRPLAGLYRR